jgi:hypothetical protein
VDKPETIRARCTGLEVVALRLLAKQEGVLVSEMLRQLVRDEAKRAGLWPPPEPEGGFSKKTKELK